jgi:AcrR family transcriptional regulator
VATPPDPLPERADGDGRGTPAPAPRERADAQRNRRKVLDAAQALLAADPRNTTMEDIARAAGVGKGTLYRRYPHKSAIAGALLDEHERELQDRLLTGPPPLGPGAPPDARLAAFYAAYVAFLEAVGQLSRAIETTEQRLATGAHQAWRLHVAGLVEAGGRGAGEDAAVLAEQLLAPLAPDLYAFERERLGRSPAAIVAALAQLAHATLGR